MVAINQPTPMNIGKWALGCWDTQTTDETDLYCGTSLFDGELTFFRVVGNPELNLVDYFLGDRDALQPRISARVIAGDVYGRKDSYCLLTLNACRDVTMDDARWHQLCMCHETEILLLKALIERF